MTELKTFQSYHFGKSLDEPVSIMMIGESNTDNDFIVYEMKYSTDTMRQEEKYVILFKDSDINNCITVFRQIVEEMRNVTS